MTFVLILCTHASILPLKRAGGLYFATKVMYDSIEESQQIACTCFILLVQDHPLSAHDHPHSAHDHPLSAHDHLHSAHDHPLSTHDHSLSVHDCPLSFKHKLLALTELKPASELEIHGFIYHQEKCANLI